MAAKTGHSRIVERVVQICAGSRDARALRLAVLDEIRTAVPYDAYSWLLTDAETEVGCAPLADVPCLPELPRLIRLKYLTPINRWTRLPTAVASLREATGDNPAASLVWRELLASYGVNDVASVVFRDRFGCWAFLELWRGDSGDRFTATEAELLGAISGPITEGLRRCVAATFDVTDSGPVHTGPVVLILSPDLHVRAQTPETEQYLKVLVPRDDAGAPVPSSAYNVAAQLLAVEAGIDNHPPLARVHLSGGAWLTVRAARIGSASPVGERDIAVTIEGTSPSERVAIFTRACGLSTREADLVAQLIAGSDTRRISEAMFVSEHTVQDHLKSIFAKTGARSRRALVVLAMGR